MASNEVPDSLDEFDVMIFPGGTAADQARTLHEAGCKAVTEFVQGGGGFVGICAGAYLGGYHPSKPWALRLLDAQFWQPEAPINLTGIVSLSLSPEIVVRVPKSASQPRSRCKHRKHPKNQRKSDDLAKVTDCVHHNGALFPVQHLGEG
eukprot:TRINITY_DN13630_c0_g1_i1.p1 TRINITY_DN13630_c0_g1~~TRINITY_DN13630_c0_g1_i1.p1  ORF type:complete len:149 (-),score=13.34 TRINITY_DN13630_c0_g1_i1:467-913(-)